MANESVRGARDLWSWFRNILVATWNSPRGPGKWASLRPRIRGGQDYLADKVATAAQFLTLRLIPIGSTHMGCDDSDGPGHAPRYLYVSSYMSKSLAHRMLFDKLGEPKWEFAIYMFIVFFSLFGVMLPTDPPNPTGLVFPFVISAVTVYKLFAYRKLCTDTRKPFVLLFLIPIGLVIALSGYEIVWWLKAIYF